MREIAFRGKRRDTDEWVYGFYAIDGDGTYIINDTDTDETSIGEWLKVDPQTVGQYTGLKDRNDVKIFEGDILRSDHQGVFVGEVYWAEAQWFGATDYLEVAVRYGAEVIGNIHDNPKLLEDWRTAKLRLGELEKPCWACMYNNGVKCVVGNCPVTEMEVSECPKARPVTLDDLEEAYGR